MISPLRFGGTFVVQNYKSISDSSHVITHRPLKNLGNLDFDKLAVFSRSHLKRASS